MDDDCNDNDSNHDGLNTEGEQVYSADADSDGAQPPAAEGSGASVEAQEGDAGGDSEPVEPLSPSAGMARIRRRGDDEAGPSTKVDGDVRWAPKRMFMDEVSRREGKEGCL